MNADLPDYSRSRAILIGTSNYQDPQFPPLPAVANSLRGLREVLTDPGLCGWPAERTTVLKNPPDVRRLMQNLRRLAQDTEDVLLVYFVGHGTILRRGQLCLVLTDTEADDSDITGLEFERVREALLDSPARTKIVILDCCYSGRAIEALSGTAAVADSTDTHGVYTLTASDHTAHVVALDQQADAYTSFTGELLDLIRTGVADGPEMLPLGLIYLNLRHRLQARGLPAPNQRGTDTADRYAFTRNAAVPEPDPVQNPLAVHVPEAPVALLDTGATPDKERPTPPSTPPLPQAQPPQLHAPQREVAPGAALDQPRQRIVSGFGRRLGPIAAQVTGTLTVILGVLILTMSDSSAKAGLLGFQMIVYGVFRAVQFFAGDESRARRRGWILTVLGVASVPAGVVVLSFAQANFFEVPRGVFAVFWIINGPAEIASAIRGGSRPGRGLEILSGVLGTATGWVVGIVASNDTEVALRPTQVAFIEAWLVVFGVVTAFIGFRQRYAPLKPNALSSSDRDSTRSAAELGTDVAGV
jgi:uncharacterized membrane protein HdeD (DUF308 family)